MCMTEWFLNSNPTVLQWLDFILTTSNNVICFTDTFGNQVLLLRQYHETLLQLESSPVTKGSSRQFYPMTTNSKHLLRCLFSCLLRVTVSGRSHKLNADRRKYIGCYQSSEKSPGHFLKWTRRLVIILPNSNPHSNLLLILSHLKHPFTTQFATAYSISWSLNFALVLWLLILLYGFPGILSKAIWKCSTSAVAMLVFSEIIPTSLDLVCLDDVVCLGQVYPGKGALTAGSVSFV